MSRFRRLRVIDRSPLLRHQLLQLERARPDEDKRREYDRSESIVLGACAVGVVALAFVIFALFGGLG